MPRGQEDRLLGKTQDGWGMAGGSLEVLLRSGMPKRGTPHSNATTDIF